MTVREILDAAPSLSVLVVGDICLDRWCTYDPDVSEASRETGIMPISVVKTAVTPGAGGTVANNLRALQVGRVAVVGVTGSDGHGYELRAALELRGIDSQRLVAEPAMQTFTYTKFLHCATNEEDQPRVDFRNTRPLPVDAEDQMLRHLETSCGEFDVVMVSDQAETNTGGVVTHRVRELLSELAIRHERKIFFVDSRKRIELFRNAILKPNEDEARAACERAFGNVSYDRLRESCNAPALIVTHGSEGALVVEAGSSEWVRTRPEAHPVDICGAGDSFSAAAVVALAAGASALEAAHLGNRAASITIMKKGTGTVSYEELEAACSV